MFPVRTSSGQWGGSLLFPHNPIAEIADIGYFRTDRRLLQSNLRIHQDLSMITQGLSAELSVAYDNDAVFKETGTQEYAYEQNDLILNPDNGEYEVVTEIKGDVYKRQPIMYPNVDWRDYMMKTGAVQTQHNLNISGGTDQVRYFISVGYLFQDGLFKDFGNSSEGYSYNRYNYRTNLDMDISKYTTLK